MKLDDRWIEEFEKHYLRILIDGRETGVVSYIAEEVAWQKVSHLGFSRCALRNHCAEVGKCERVGRNSWRYKEQYIVELSQEWVKASNVQATMHRSKSRFHEDIRKSWSKQMIGHVLLLKKADILGAV